MIPDLRRRPCQALLSTSFCPTSTLDGPDGCPFNHDLPHCETCGLHVNSTQMLEAHLRGKPHRQQLARVARAGAGAAVPRNSARCDVCDMVVPSHHRKKHVAGVRHVRAAQHQRYRAAIAYSEAPKFGVSISPPKLAFGAVDLGSLSDVESEVIEGIVIASGASGCTLLGAQLQSAELRRHFHVEPITVQRVVKPRGREVVLVRFRPRQTLGNFSDVLVVSLAVNTPKGRQTFSIRRSITASVLVQADVDAFGPKTPYAPPQTSVHPRAENVVPGPRTASAVRVPWVRRLGPYSLPPFVKNALQGGDIKHQIRMAYQHLLPETLNYALYGSWWSALLYIEQVQEEIDIRRYDLFGVKLERHSRALFYLEVPGLAEGRTSVLKGDSIQVRECVAGSRWYDGVVNNVRQCEVGLHFHQSFNPSPSATFDCQFINPRFPARRMHQVLGGPLPREQLLFPTASPIDSFALTPALVQGHPAFTNAAILNNAEQALAVRCIFNETQGLAPFVLYGPPGTGKTVTIIEACTQLLKYSSRTTLLLAAPSNSACDLLAERLIASSGLGTTELLRLTAASRDIETVPHRLQPFCYQREDSFACPPLAKLQEYRVIVTTCVSAFMLEGVGMPKGHFSHIFVDEAGQALEPEVLLALAIADDRTSVILAGDPKQLGPIIRSPVATAHGLATSYLERLMKLVPYSSNEARGVTFVKLLDNYRSHPSILQFPNSEFYEGELRNCAARSTSHRLEKWKGWPNDKFPIIFHALSGGDAREGNSPSFFNVAEISQVKAYVNALRDARPRMINDNDIGIISPYASQVKKLRRAINADAIMVGSTENFQGQERGFIIMSTVRSNRSFLEMDKRFSLGFRSNPKRFNVAITRAQAGLIIVGDPDILALDPPWRRFLLFIHRNGGWAGMPWDTTPYEVAEVSRSNGAGSRAAAVDPLARARRDMDDFSAAMEALQLDDAEQGEGLTAAEVGFRRDE